MFIAQELCPRTFTSTLRGKPNLTANKRIKLLRGIAEGGISWLHDDESRKDDRTTTLNLKTCS